MKKKFKLLFAMLVVVVVALPFANAVSEPTITMNTNGKFYIGESQEFSITTTVPEGYQDITVVGDGGISDPSAIEKLEYFEVSNNTWIEFPANTGFGGTSGFPLRNATSKFRVTFGKTGNYEVRYAVKDVDTEKIVASNVLEIVVEDRTIRNVTNEQELKEALKDKAVKTINIANDITTTQKINITRDVTINGNSHKIAINVADKFVWGGYYVLQAYKSNVIINDIALTGGNAGLLVNKSNVTLNGKINVSDNGFGGIELTGENPTINLKNATLVNTTEAYLLPTLWVDPKMENITVDYNKFQAKIEVDKGDHLQSQYYLNKFNSFENASSQIDKQINSGATTIEVITNSNDVIKASVLNALKNGPAREVNIYTDNARISFNTKNITEDFTSDLKLGVAITGEQPFDSDILNKNESELLFIDLKHNGTLPKGTKITFSTQGKYKQGEKVFLYYYNPETNQVELISKDIEISDDMATITIDHASVYFLSNKELTANVNITNPNTSDITIYIIAILAIIALSGFTYVAKAKMSNK